MIQHLISIYRHCPCILGPPTRRHHCITAPRSELHIYSSDPGQNITNSTANPRAQSSVILHVGRRRVPAPAAIALSSCTEGRPVWCRCWGRCCSRLPSWWRRQRPCLLLRPLLRRRQGRTTAGATAISSRSATRSSTLATSSTTPRRRAPWRTPPTARPSSTAPPAAGPTAASSSTSSVRTLCECMLPIDC